METRVTNITTRDGDNISLWQATRKTAPTGIGGDIEYDVVIIGGGITGLTTALLLQEAGKKCLVVDAHTVGFGTTGGTSAHINTFADTTYKEAESAFGEEGAQLFADGINEGFGLIRNNIAKYSIECDFEEKNGYVYAEDEKQMEELRDIYEGATKVGVPVNFATDVPTPIAYKEALIFSGQAQFHPLKYLFALEQAYIEAGGSVLEHMKITKVTSSDDGHLVETEVGLEIKAQHVVYATHMPSGINMANFRCAPYRSYVLGVILNDKNYPDALIYDMQEPYHYFRTHEVREQKYLLVGGNDHKTGHDDPEKAFAELEKYVRKHYDVADVSYKWSSQYYVPVDGFPYIGRMPVSKNIYCATGYNGNGMMLGSLSGKIISDLILERENKYEKIFSPARSKPIAGFEEFVKENADVLYQFIAGRFSGNVRASLDRIKNDHGELVEHEGHQLAVYRDDLGDLHILNPVCTHAKCIVNWNATERTWDCPCHGARYDIDGKVLTGPATKDLEQIQPKDVENK